ncbi:MAG: ABC transporter ATP-binding protein [Myxococcales bacterium]|nr:ABC transporter ATP-binding protein [Myxococcales bacterium]
MLRVEQARAGYGAVEVLRGISLTVDEGEIVTLIGANGAGKTTTLHTLSGLVQLTGGRITFLGENIAGVPAHELVRRGLVHAPEGRKIFSRLTVLENLEMGAYTRRDPDGIARDLARVFELFPILAERRRQAGGTLSGGEQQMLAVGRAMMARPRLLLLDEPSLGLAPLIVARIFEVIRELSKSGVTILLVEQNARMALRLAHRGYVMETGAILLADAASALLENETVRAAYLGE